jgi:hypothetical protein
MQPTSATIASFLSALARWLAPVMALALVACQSATITPGFAPVSAPKFAVGDHWLFKITDNLRLGAVTMLDASVVSINAGTATIRLVYNDQYGLLNSALRPIFGMLRLNSNPPNWFGVDTTTIPPTNDAARWAVPGGCSRALRVRAHRWCARAR